MLVNNYYQLKKAIAFGRCNEPQDNPEDDTQDILDVEYAQRLYKEGVADCIIAHRALAAEFADLFY